MRTGFHVGEIRWGKHEQMVGKEAAHGVACAKRLFPGIRFPNRPNVPAGFVCRAIAFYGKRVGSATQHMRKKRELVADMVVGLVSQLGNLDSPRMIRFADLQRRGAEHRSIVGTVNRFERRGTARPDHVEQVGVIALHFGDEVVLAPSIGPLEHAVQRR